MFTKRAGVMYSIRCYKPYDCGIVGNHRIIKDINGNEKVLVLLENSHQFDSRYHTVIDANGSIGLIDQCNLSCHE